MSRPQFHHRGRGGDSAHDEDDNHEAAAAAITDMDQKPIDTTILNNVMVCLPLFLSSKSVLAKMIEETGHIILLSSKFH